MLIIRNGTLIDPEGNRLIEGDLYLADGIIQKIEVRSKKQAQTPPAGKGAADLREASAESTYSGTNQEAQVIDAAGMLIGPGLIDTHVHFRDPGFTYKEDILTGGEAAKRGGYTSVVMMANTKPAIDSVETLSYVLHKGKETGIHVYSCATVTKGMEGHTLVDMETLSDAVGFTDDGKPLMDTTLVTEAMQRVKALDKPISFHEENPARITNNGINAGEAAASLGALGSPREAEIDMIERDTKLALQTGAKVVIQHISSAEGVELVRRAKAAGADIHAEATPHHFTLTEQALLTKGTLAKMNPPLRTEEDRLAIIEGLRDGTIDIIATDHAPHSKEEKDRGLLEAPSGILGLETALPLAIRELVQKGYLTYPQLFMRMSTAPARLYKLPGGSLKEGAPADLVLFEDTESFTVKQFASKSQNSPFIGETLPGVVKMVICGGKSVYINPCFHAG